MADLTICRLCKSFQQTVVFDGLDLTVAAGQLLVLLGPSGSGKTTMLRLIAGLEFADGGEILIAGRPVQRLRPQHRNVSMVFQDFALYPHMTVYDNMAFGLQARRLPKQAGDARIRSVAEKLGLGELLGRKPDQLSGGQQQRLAVARAVVRESDLLLMDEPLSNVDARLRDTMRIELRLLQREFGLTIVYVTHDQAEAMLLGDRIAVINEGRVQQIAAPATIYDEPANRFVAQFVGSPPMNFLPGEPGTEIGVRPEELSFQQTHTGDLAVAGTIQTVDCLGANNIIRIRSEQGLIAVTAGREHEPRVGQQVTAYAPADRLHRFRTTDGARIACRDR